MPHFLTFSLEQDQSNSDIPSPREKKQTNVHIYLVRGLSLMETHTHFHNNEAWEAKAWHSLTKRVVWGRVLNWQNESPPHPSDACALLVSTQHLLNSHLNRPNPEMQREASGGVGFGKSLPAIVDLYGNLGSTSQDESEL
ncbi:hypothetical protein P7K49_007409 [Saguinus oedipus]|uniref:Uncharacterized protein n=1 Tax=Saguinus oedipus TaxID=9490 RepID=A0ABQ9VUS7_SAGOE|nr:hypothetical protein P7K49_007409 [Saguinus oedipus]